jgi:hypothetical protein
VVRDEQNIIFDWRRLMAIRKRRTILKFRKNDPAHNLLAATQHWVRANGGDLIVVGGIGVLTEGFGGSEYKFKVAIGCCGTAPKKKEAPDGI